MNQDRGTEILPDTLAAKPMALLDSNCTLIPFTIRIPTAPLLQAKAHHVQLDILMINICG